MNETETIRAVHNSMYHQIQKIGYITSVQLLLDLQILSKEDYCKTSHYSNNDRQIIPNYSIDFTAN